MLQKINQYTRGWFAWVVVGLIAITFAFWGASNYSGTHVDTTIAEVNGQSITAQVYRSAYEQLRQQVSARMGTDFQITADIDRQLKQQALENLITETVLEQAALKAGYYISMPQTEQVLMQIPSFQENGHFSRSRFNQLLGSLSLSEKQFLEKLQGNLLIDQVRDGIVNSSFVLPDEVDDIIKLTEQSRNIRYLLMPSDRFVNEIQITNDEIKKYYQQHPEEFKTPEKVSVDYVELSLSSLLQRIKLTPQQLSDYYQSHQANFKTQSEWRVAHIVVKIPNNATAKQINDAKSKSEKIAAQLKQGIDFSKLAKEFSDDLLTADKGGLSPWFKQGTMDPQFESVAMSLSKNGEISKPSKTKYGFDIIKLIETKPSQQIGFDGAKQGIENLLKQQQAQQLFADLSEQLANLTYSNPDSLKVAATTLKLPIQATSLFTRQGDTQGILANKKIVNTAFSDDVLLQANNSEVIQLDSSTLVVLRLKDHKPATLIALEKVQDKIRNILTKQQQQTKAAALAAKLEQGLRAGNNTEALEKQYKLVWTTLSNLTRHVTTVDQAIATTAFSLPQLTHGLSIRSVPVKENYALVVLQRVVPADMKLISAEKRNAYEQQLKNAMGEVNFELYVTSIMKQAKIKRKSLDS